MRVSKMSDLKQSTPYAGTCPTFGGKCWVCFDRANPPNQSTLTIALPDQIPHPCSYHRTKVSPNQLLPMPAEPKPLHMPPNQPISHVPPDQHTTGPTYYRTNVLPDQGISNQNHHRNKECRTNFARPDCISPGPPAAI